MPATSGPAIIPIMTTIEEMPVIMPNDALPEVLSARSAAVSACRTAQARPWRTAKTTTIQSVVAEASRNSAIAWAAMHATTIDPLVEPIAGESATELARDLNDRHQRHDDRSLAEGEPEPSSVTSVTKCTIAADTTRSAEP